MSSRFKLSIITAVSSANRPFRSLLSPLASAAMISARFVKLFDPGGVNSAEKGRCTGCIVTSLMAATLPSRCLIPHADAIQTIDAANENLPPRDGRRSETILPDRILRHQLKFRRGLDHKHLPIIR